MTDKPSIRDKLASAGYMPRQMKLLFLLHLDAMSDQQCETLMTLLARRKDIDWQKAIAEADQLVVATKEESKNAKQRMHQIYEQMEQEENESMIGESISNFPGDQ